MACWKIWWQSVNSRPYSGERGAWIDMAGGALESRVIMVRSLVRRMSASEDDCAPLGDVDRDSWSIWCMTSNSSSL